MKLSTEERKSVLLLTFIMVFIAIFVAGIMLSVLYDVAFEEQQERLTEIVKSRTRMIEAVARFDAEHHRDSFPGGAYEATLKQIREAHRQFKGFGETGEFVLAKREGDQILFLLRPRHFGEVGHKSIPFSSNFAEPMRFALSGEAGTVIGFDYRGEKVLAAYEPVKVLDLGVVAKIDLAEIRAPFIRAALLAGTSGILLIGFGTIFFRRIGNRLLQRLEESELKYRTIVEQSADAVVLIDIAGGGFEVINDNAHNNLGYTREEFARLRLSDIESTKSPRDVERHLKQIVTEGAHTVETGHRTKNGEIRDVLVSSRAISIGGRTYVHAVWSDITERNRMMTALQESREQLQAAQKMEAIGTLAGGVAHDFNNLLTAILGYTELLLENTDPADPNHADLEEILATARRAAALTGQLLSFSRRQPLQPRIVDLNGLISELERMLRRIIGEDIRMALDFGDMEERIRADYGQIGQVVMNLAVNAQCAMPNGGRLEVKTECIDVDEAFCRTHALARPGRFVCLSIEDTGIGMDEETIAHIFEPFYTTKGPGEGTGMGLAVVYGIVNQHKGWIDVESSPGQGTTFRIYLPALTGADAEESRKEVPIETLRGEGERVLLVEDEESVRGLVERTLLENGYTVFSAATVKEALEIFAREKEAFHLILSDVILPDETGIQLVERLLSKKPELQVLLCSGYTEQKSQWSIIEERAFHFLQKPYTMTSLLQTVRKILIAGRADSL